MIIYLKELIWIVAICVLLPSSWGQSYVQIRGWNILSDSYDDDMITINAARSYNINHLQLSHDLVMDLQEIRDPDRQKVVNELISKAHEAGIKEVVVWDHALYNLKYHPGQFKTGPDGTINTSFSMDGGTAQLDDIMALVGGRGNGMEQ